MGVNHTKNGVAIEPQPNLKVSQVQKIEQLLLERAQPGSEVFTEKSLFLQKDTQPCQIIIFDDPY